MASVCGSTLALMDAGVAIKAPVAGIAMGLMSDGKKFTILTDIQGVEDFTGDMDFKVAGTRKGITALQLDTKLAGIPEQVLADALSQAKDARYTILDIIENEIKAPRPELSGSAPRITRIKINPEKIGTVIGPGGATIRRITEATGCDIDVQKDGTILISSTAGEKAAKAVEEIKALTYEVEVGTEFTGEVTRLMGRGALVALPGGRDGMVTTDQFLEEKIRHPEQVVAVGEVLNVKVHEVDSMGRVNLTAKGLNPDHPILGGHEEPREANPNSERGDRDRGDRGDRGDRRGGGMRRGGPGGGRPRR
jgi:polyribonucleotide nucleotidyltransferase